MSRDVLFGTVTRVIDGDTFVVDRIGRSQHNRYPYADEETIRIASIDAPELSTRAGKRVKREMEDALIDARVRLDVQARDAYGRVIADVSYDM